MKRARKVADQDCGAHCRKIRDEVHHLLDGHLSAARKAALRRHLSSCRTCFSRVEFARVLKRLVRERVCSESCPGNLLHRVRSALWAPKQLKSA